MYGNSSENHSKNPCRTTDLILYYRGTHECFWITCSYPTIYPAIANPERIDGKNLSKCRETTLRLSLPIPLFYRHRTINIIIVIFHTDTAISQNVFLPGKKKKLILQVLSFSRFSVNIFNTPLIVGDPLEV